VLHDAGIPNIPGKETRGVGDKHRGQICSNEKSLRLFPGFRYRTLEDSIPEMVKQLVQEGYMTS
jgi:hypothetical protein